MVDTALDSWSKIRKRRLEKNFTKLDTGDRQKTKQEDEIRKAKEFYVRLGKCGFSECLGAYIVAKGKMKRSASIGSQIEQQLAEMFAESERALYHE